MIIVVTKTVTTYWLYPGQALELCFSFLDKNAACFVFSTFSVQLFSLSSFRNGIYIYFESGCVSTVVVQEWGDRGVPVAPMF